MAKEATFLLARDILAAMIPVPIRPQRCCRKTALASGDQSLIEH
jgi:hypothetical protein